jgi:hypothetical protein
MSLDKPETIDALSDDRAGATVWLSIIDGWDWSDEAAHLIALQTKLDTYFDFVQSGQIFEVRPGARGKNLKIGLVTKYPLPGKATRFLEIAARAAQQLHLEIAHRVLPSQGDGQ